MKDIKTKIIDCIIEDTLKKIQEAKHRKKEAINEANQHKGAMESRYDTFREEAQYLAGGFETRLIELEIELNKLKAIKDSNISSDRCSVYSIIKVENLEDGSNTNYFLLPVGGGEKYSFNGADVVVISIGSPVGTAFIGKVVGDRAGVYIGKKIKSFKIISAN